MGDYVKNKMQASGGNPGGRRYTDDFRDRTPHLVDVEGNINLDREFLEGRSDMEQQMTSMGFDVGRLDLAEADYADMYRDWNKLDAMEVPDFYDPFEAESYEFERWAITDLAAGLWNRGVAGMVSGVAQAPALLGAAITGSEEGDFWDTWIDGVNEMEEGMSIQASDKALKPMTDGFNANNFAYAFGDGLGFMADIFLGSKGAGALLKAGSAASKIQRTQRLGTFITGTMQMQKDLYKEGIAAGLSPGNAARVAIPTAMVVSASEGAALEMLGMTISGQMLRGASRSALRAELKALGKAGGELNLANFKKLVPSTARSVGQKMKDFGTGFVKGYPVEATQEFVQTYIEDLGKHAYDTWFAGKDAVKGAGKFGVDWKETFEKAVVSGIVGGMVGGTIGGGGSAIRGIEGNTTFTYVKDAIDNNKPGKVKRLINKVNRMGSTGAIKNAPEVIQAIKDMTRYSQSIKGLNIDSSTANFQLFQLNQIQDEFQTKFGKEFKTDAKTNYLIANAYRINEEKATMLTQAMNNEMQVLIQDKKPLTKDLNKFERKLSNYQNLFHKIQKGKINKEELVSEIRKNESPVVTKWRQQIEAEMEAIKQSQLDNDGVSINQELDNLDDAKAAKKAEGKQFAYTELPGNKKASKEAINDFEKLVAEKEKVNQLADTDVNAVEKFATKLEQQYGMSIQDLTALEENWSIGEEIGKKSKEGKLKYKEPTKTKAKQETTDKPLTEDEKRIEAFAQNFAESTTDENNRRFAKDAKEDEAFYEANKEAIEKRTSEIKAEKMADDMLVMGDEFKAWKPGTKEEKFYNENKELVDKKLEELKAEKKKPETKEKETKKKEVKEEAPKNKLQELSDSIDNNKNLNERDLNAYQDELQKLADEGVGTVEERAELNDKIAKNREQLKSLTEEQIIEEAPTEAKKEESKEEVKEDLTEEMVPEGVDEETLLEEREKAKKDVEYSKLLNEENTITNKLKKVGLTGKERDGLRKRLKEIQKEKKEIEDTDKGQEQEYVAPSKEEEKNSQDAFEKRRQRRNRIKKDQRKNIEKDNLERNLIQNNPQLFNKILNHFKKLFPNVPVNQIENALWKHGPITVAEISKNGVDINVDTAFQNTLLHEGAHIIKDILGDNHPLIKAGMQFIKGTQYFKNAQILYPELTVEEQAEEALMEAIADNSLEKLKTKLEGTNLQKFVAWLKRFWNAAKKAIGLKKGKQSVDMLADMLAYSKTPYNANLGLLPSFKQQRSIQHLKTINEVQVTAALSRMDYMLGESKFNPNEGFNLQTMVYEDLADLLVLEQEIPESNSIFDGLSSESVKSILEAKTQAKKAQKLMWALKTESKELWNIIETSTRQLSKKTLPVLDDVENLIKVSLKRDDNVSNSVRSIVTALVDNNGFLYDSNLVYQQIAKIADVSVDINSFEKTLKDLADNGNDIAHKLNLILDSFEDSTKRGILSELASLTTIEYRSLIKNTTVQDGKKKVSVLWKRVNKDRTVEDQINEMSNHWKNADLQQIKSLLNETINQEKIGQLKYWKAGLKNNWFRYSKNIFEQLFGIKLSEKEYLDFLNNYVKSAVATKDLSKQQVERRRLKGLIGFRAKGKSYGRLTEAFDQIEREGKLDKKQISGVLRQLALAKQGDALATNFVNQAGNNVTATRLGYWVNQFNKLFTYDKGFRGDINKSNLYKDNPIINYWNKSKDKPEWFIHDAFENVGYSGAIEHSYAEVNDIILNNFFYFSQNKGIKDAYFQSIGVTGDRGHLTYFKVPKFKGDRLKQEYKKRALLDEQLINNRVKNTGKSLNEVVIQFNKTSLNEAVIENGKVVVKTPYEGNKFSKKINQEVDKIYGLLEKTDTIESVQSANPDVDVKSIIGEYIYNESLNRSYLTDIYAGPAIYKKSVADVMKRMAGLNSGGKLINIDKPVHVFVIDTKKMSDSFSFNGSHFAKRLTDMSGDTDVVGVNVKDMLYEIGPEGDLDFYKMSTLNVTGDVDANSLTEFADQNDLANPTGYNAIGNAILEIEKALGGDAYVKVIDKDVVKGDLSQYEYVDVDTGKVRQAIPIEQFVENPTKFASKEQRAYKLKNFKNYRVAFNLNKDLTKVPLSKQNHVLSTQLAKILLNYDVSQNEIQKFEDSLVNVLRDSLEIKGDDYYKSAVVNRLKYVNSLLENLTANSEENTKSEIIEILTEMQKINDKQRLTTYKIGPYVYNKQQISNLGALSDLYENVYIKQTQTEDVWEERLKQNELTLAQFDNLMANDIITKSENDQLSEYEQETVLSKKAKEPLESFDHPNLKPMVEQFIASRLTKTGVRTEIAGMYAHMMPDMSNKLKGYKENGLEPMEVAVPWSMFVEKKEGEEDAEAKARAEQMLKDSPEKFKTVVVRVPASGAVSQFVGQVKYFIDGHSNTSIVPKEFVDASDADHDGDKVFVYKAEINTNGDIVEGSKTDAFNQIYERANSKATKEAATKGSLSLDLIKDMLVKLDLYNEDVFKLNNYEDFAKLANNMSFGQDAIGIWAIASKMLSVLSQSEEQLKTPISFGFKNGKLIEEKRQKFTNNALDDVARFLQAALDMGNDPIHISTGINENTIGVATALSLMDVKFEEIIEFLNSPTIVKLNEDISSAKTNYIDKGTFSVNRYLKEKKGELGAKKGDLTKNALNEIIERGGKKKLAKDVQPGIYSTKDGKSYYKVEDLGNRTAGYSFASENDLANKDELAIIKKFAELQEIATDLQRLIPVLQLDNKLPNNGFDVRKTLEILEDMVAGDFKFTTDRISQRPLIKHYRNLLKQQQRVYNSKFYINDSQFYDEALTMASNIWGTDNGIYKHKNVYKAMEESMYLYRAQKEFNNKIDVSAKFIDDTVNKYETIIGAINNPNNNNLFVSKPFGISEDAFNQVITELQSAKSMGEQVFQRELQRLLESQNAIERVIGERVEADEENKAIAFGLRNNAFIKHLTIRENKDGTKHIVPVSSLNDMTTSGLKIIQDSYNQLPENIQNEIRAYAMLRFGIASKLGSISKMFPTGMSIAVLKNSNELLKYGIGVESETNFFANKENVDLLKANTAIMMKETLPLVTPAEDIQSEKDVAYNEYYFSGDKAYVNTNSEFVRIGEDVYRRVGDSDSRIFENLRDFGGVKSKGYNILIRNKNLLAKTSENFNKEKEEVRKCFIGL